MGRILRGTDPPSQASRRIEKRRLQKIRTPTAQMAPMIRILPAVRATRRLRRIRTTHLRRTAQTIQLLRVDLIIQIHQAARTIQLRPVVQHPKHRQPLEVLVERAAERGRIHFDGASSEKGGPRKFFSSRSFHLQFRGEEKLLALAIRFNPCGEGLHKLFQEIARAVARKIPFGIE